jgi:hypothetical protein
MQVSHRTLGRAIAAALLAWLLAACGPGVGGTGTGNGAVPPGVAGLTIFDAQPADACLAPFGTLIGCTPGSIGGDPLPGAPTTLAGECAVATFDGNDVALDVLCLGWTFSGRWGLGGDGSLRYYGLVGQDLLLPPTEPATLEVQVQGSALVLWLRAANGQLLAGPLALRRT